MDKDTLLYMSSIICILLTIYQIFNHQKGIGILSSIVLFGYSLLSPLLSFRTWGRSHMVVLSPGTKPHIHSLNSDTLHF